jgi:antitoxin component YwqK of YwqJK toxin-antitoxin module
MNQSDQRIDKIKKQCPEKKYLFKSCQFCWIVILQKLDETITTQERFPINYSARLFAKYRANKLRVTKIINKFNPNKTTNRVSSSVYNENKVDYIEGEIVIPDSFNKKLDDVCSHGIHFFESVEPAFYYELDTYESYTGHFVSWHQNGQKRAEGDYLDGNKNGNWITWHDSQQKRSEGDYSDGNRTGPWKFWDKYGNMTEE